MSRLAVCMDRLSPHLTLAEVAVTGGVALEHHLPGSRPEVADLDLVVRRANSVARTVVFDFLISHHHLPGPGVPKAILQLVDPVSRLRVDIFPDLTGVIGRAVSGQLERWTLLVVRAEDLLAHKLQTVWKATASRPEDPKHWRDARRLADHLGVALPDLTPHLAPPAYAADPEARCERCERSQGPALPLAPKRAIFELLGYV